MATKKSASKSPVKKPITYALPIPPTPITTGRLTTPAVTPPPKAPVTPPPPKAPVTPPPPPKAPSPPPPPVKKPITYALPIPPTPITTGRLTTPAVTPPPKAPVTPPPPKAPVTPPPPPKAPDVTILPVKTSNQEKLEAIAKEIERIRKETGVIREQADILEKAKRAGMPITPKTTVEEAAKFLRTTPPKTPETPTPPEPPKSPESPEVIEPPPEPKPLTLEEFEKELEKIKTEREFMPTPTLTPTIIGRVYDIPKIQKEIEDTKTKLASAERALIGYQTKRYDEEYKKAGLEAIKGQIADLDKQIANEKQRRDISISQVRRNPYYSAATIAGEIAEIERLANATINNLIEERNAIANRYNMILGEITAKVARETAEKEKEVSRLRDNLEGLIDQLRIYEGIRERELARGREIKEWELDFAFKLAEAKRKREQWEAEERRKWAELERKEKVAIPTEDIETYARDILAGRLTLTSVPQEIRPQVSRRVEELRKTERTWDDEEWRARIRTEINRNKTKENIRDMITTLRTQGIITDADKERGLLILDEMMPEPKPAEKKRGIRERIKEWFKGEPKRGLPAYRKPIA